MIKFCKLALVVVGAILFCSGCMGVSSSVPTAALPLEGLKTDATYDILGPAEGTSSGAHVLGFIPVAGESKSGTIGTSLSLKKLYSSVQQAAIYNAIESVPTADALLAPRFHTTRKSYVIYTKETVTVRGKAIRFNPSGK